MSKELREQNPDSIFIDECYDTCIIGIDPTTDSIIYDREKLTAVLLEIEKEDGQDLTSEEFQDSEEWDELWDNCQSMIFEEFSKYRREYVEGYVPSWGTNKVAPTLLESIQ